MRAQRGSPFGSGGQRDAGLHGEGIGLRSLGRILVGGEVVTGESTSEFLRTKRLEEPSSGKVADLAVPLGEGVVGDLADERLDEGVLAQLRRAGVGFQRQQLAAHEFPETRLQRRRFDARDRGETSDGEALAEHRGIGHQRSILGWQTVEARLAMSAVSVSGTARLVRSPTGR